MPEALLPVKGCCVCSHSHFVLYEYMEAFLGHLEPDTKKRESSSDIDETNGDDYLKEQHRRICKYVLEANSSGELPYESEVSLEILHKHQSIRCESFLTRLHLFLTAELLPASIKKLSSYKDAISAIHFIMLVNQVEILKEHDIPKAQQDMNEKSLYTINRIEESFAMEQVNTLRQLKGFIYETVPYETDSENYRKWLIQDRGLSDLLDSMTAKWLSISESSRSREEDFSRGLRYLIKSWKPFISIIPIIDDAIYIQNCSNRIESLFDMLYRTVGTNDHVRLIDVYWRDFLLTIMINENVLLALEGLTSLKNRAIDLLKEGSAERLADTTLKIIDSNYPVFKR